VRRLRTVLTAFDVLLRQQLSAGIALLDNGLFGVRGGARIFRRGGGGAARVSSGRVGLLAVAVRRPASAVRRHPSAVGPGWAPYAGRRCRRARRRGARGWARARPGLGVGVRVAGGRAARGFSPPAGGAFSQPANQPRFRARIAATITRRALMTRLPKCVVRSFVSRPRRPNRGLYGNGPAKQDQAHLGGRGYRAVCGVVATAGSPCYAGRNWCPDGKTRGDAITNGGACMDRSPYDQAGGSADQLLDRGSSRARRF